MKPTLTLFLLFITYFISAQDFDGARPTGSSNYGVNLGFQYNTNIQFTTRTWSGSHGILFNSYKASSPVSGSLGTTGNTKYANNVGSYTSGAGAIMFYGNGGTMDFLISPSSTGAGQDIAWGTPKMRIKRSGNVGIGTTSPDEKLSVKGRIHAEEVRVDLSVPGPDYVFEPTYDLKSLEEIEQYIQSEKHLPEIPSAKEMEANGVQLGEMNMLLLKKIEELTLHAIEQEKRISQLEPYPSLWKEREAKQGELEKRLDEMMKLISAQQKEIEVLKANSN